MLESVRKRVKKAGLPPETLVHTGDQKIEQVRITQIVYDDTSIEERPIEAVEECAVYLDKPAVTWINVDGLHQVEILAAIGECFGLHPLVLEDILNTDQRPKMADLGDYIFVVLKSLAYNAENSDLEAEQISLILGPNFVLSFQERAGDVFDPIRERLRIGKGRIRRMGADYLAYALLDAVVDGYFVVLERLGEQIELLEDQLVSNPTPETLSAIHRAKRDVLFLRKSVWPVREAVSGLDRGESSLVQASTGMYLRDLYDHTIQVIDVVETFRDMLSGMLDIYLSSISNKMNEVMKVLTIIATIFIPLTFIAGVYGMNFQYMPELGWRWGYPLVWLVMLIIAALMVVYFRRKKWL